MKTIEQISKELGLQQAELQEELASAFLAKYKISPEDACLVIQNSHITEEENKTLLVTNYWYRLLTEKEKYIRDHPPKANQKTIEQVRDFIKNKLAFVITEYKKLNINYEEFDLKQELILEILDFIDSEEK